jgi:excisionase family DNA binding protein
MQELKAKDVLTTGEVARICNVAPRTVSKWFDSGQLKGYRIPGSKDRRIPLNGLIRFMKQHSIPLNGLRTGNTRVLIVDPQRDVVDVIEKVLEDEARYEVEIADTAFAAGVLAERFRPHAILLDMHLKDIDARGVLEQIRVSPELQLTKVVIMSDRLTEAQGAEMIHKGFDAFLKKPFHVRQVLQAIELATQVAY